MWCGVGMLVCGVVWACLCVVWCGHACVWRGRVLALVIAYPACNAHVTLM